MRVHGGAVGVQVDEANPGEIRVPGGGQRGSGSARVASRRARAAFVPGEPLSAAARGIPAGAWGRFRAIGSAEWAWPAKSIVCCGLCETELEEPRTRRASPPIEPSFPTTEPRSDRVGRAAQPDGPNSSTVLRRFAPSRAAPAAATGAGARQPRRRP